jgi:hypothetical protein
MRTAYRTLFLLAVLGVSAGLTTPRPAMSVTCVLVDQECLRCYPVFAQKCNYYECSDGSEPVYCGACSSTCIVP